MKIIYYYSLESRMLSSAEKKTPTIEDIDIANELVTLEKWHVSSFPPCDFFLQDKILRFNDTHVEAFPRDYLNMFNFENSTVGKDRFDRSEGLLYYWEFIDDNLILHRKKINYEERYTLYPILYDGSDFLFMDVKNYRIIIFSKVSEHRSSSNGVDNCFYIGCSSFPSYLDELWRKRIWEKIDYLDQDFKMEGNWLPTVISKYREHKTKQSWADFLQSPEWLKFLREREEAWRSIIYLLCVTVAAFTWCWYGYEDAGLGAIVLTASIIWIGFLVNVIFHIREGLFYKPIYNAFFKFLSQRCEYFEYDYMIKTDYIINYIKQEFKCIFQ